MNAFETHVQERCGLDIQAQGVRILQVNVGFKCNLSCRHCHLECGPHREEMMDWETMNQTVRAVDQLQPEMIDITGGSPELHPHLKRFILSLRSMGHTVQARTNLSVLLEQGSEGMPEFYKENRVRLVASMPCYLEENVNRQRGEGVYKKNVRMLRILNDMGYGKDEDLPLFLVYNPAGPVLPPEQRPLEEDYKRELSQRFGIVFTGLYTITNMPIGRFWDGLKRENKAEEYMKILLRSFNCLTVDELMCRYQVSVGWDGTLYDCDFNLALGLPVQKGLPCHISDFDPDRLANRNVVTGKHCFGCTAGLGSSCGGALASSQS
jgi:radical SAM/Cys-rich protein